MPEIPSDHSLEASPELLGDGYAFITKRGRRLGTDIFQTRLLFEPTICLYGRDAAELFYDPEHFVRAGAAPKRLQRTLLGTGGVQGLDGAPHRHLKALHMSFMSPAELTRLTELTAEQWDVYADSWTHKGRVVLFDEVMELLCKAACLWAGVPLGGAAGFRTRELAAMIDAPAAVGPRYLKGRLSRIQGDAWAAGLIRRVRKGTLHTPEGSALFKIATFRKLDGKLLSQHEAAVALLNVVRPIVAVARYIAFAALALHQYPQCRRRVQSDEGYLELFVQEVRRFYPFFPFAAARVRATFSWRGFRFPKGRRVLLDLYGTNHDARLWGEPDEFIPERFRQWDGSAYTFIPQGGGDHYFGHRCAGEWVTISLMKEAVKVLSSLRYTVPPQDLSVSLARMPAIPKSRLIMTDVQRVA